VRAIRAAGGEIGHAFVIFHYGIFKSSLETLAAEQVRLHALATWWDVVAVAEGLGYFQPGQLAAVRAFLEDPDGWKPAA
jgi:orotate phosphoribosyltransferase